jgi:hypothetical protein
LCARAASSPFTKRTKDNASSGILHRPMLFRKRNAETRAPLPPPAQSIIAYLAERCALWWPLTGRFDAVGYFCAYGSHCCCGVGLAWSNWVLRVACRSFRFIYCSGELFSLRKLKRIRKHKALPAYTAERLSLMYRDTNPTISTNQTSHFDNSAQNCHVQSCHAINMP